MAPDRTGDESESVSKPRPKIPAIRLIWLFAGVRNRQSSRNDGETEAGGGRSVAGAPPRRDRAEDAAVLRGARGHRRTSRQQPSPPMRPGTSTSGIHFHAPSNEWIDPRVGARSPEAVSLIGDFNGWNREAHPIGEMLPTGVWQLKLPADALAHGQKGEAARRGCGRLPARPASRPASAARCRIR
jgi:hypothetical protein